MKKKKRKNKGKYWRRLYSYICRLCQKRRRTLRFDRLVETVCRKCIRDNVPDNQRSLFPGLAPIEHIGI